ncbi:MAG: hypothetical protein R3B90_17670 [Planctomycetaceae bacterium]
MAGIRRGACPGAGVAVVVLCGFIASSFIEARADEPQRPATLIERLSRGDDLRLIGYTPTGIDPRQPAQNLQVKSSSLKADLQAIRSRFNGLVLYGYNEGSTPRIVALAAELGFEAIVLGVWEVRSADEIDGVAALARQFSSQMTIAVCVGNEGLTFGRYEPDDLQFAFNRIRSQIPADVLTTTSEPLVGYQSEFVRRLGDFLFPNIHPAWDRPELAPASAVEWVRTEAARLARQSMKPVIVKETGLPHAYRHDKTPEYTPQLQAEFWRSYRAAGVRQVLDGEPAVWASHAVAFEAFDLPWKAEASGFATEQAWGLFSKDRVPYLAAEAWAADQ